MEDYEKVIFNRMSNWLEEKYLQELALMSPSEIKEEFYLQGGEYSEVLT